MSESVLQVERLGDDGAVARVTLHRPAERNAFNAELIEALHRAFTELADEPAERLRGIVLAGAGPVFCAGADVTWMRDAARLSREENEADAERLATMLDAIDRAPAPVIARVHGTALGGGMGLCAVADIVLATANAGFGFTETKLGILPATIASFVVPKIGESHARALFATGQRFDAQRAWQIGLVHEVLPDVAALDQRVDEILDELRGAGPTAARAAKAIVRELRGRGPDESRRISIARIAAQRTSQEGQAGLASFLAKRPPPWRP